MASDNKIEKGPTVDNFAPRRESPGDGEKERAQPPMRGNTRTNEQ
jgi:hypothetical protein